MARAVNRRAGAVTGRGLCFKGGGEEDLRVLERQSLGRRKEALPVLGGGEPEWTKPQRNQSSSPLVSGRERAGRVAGRGFRLQRALYSSPKSQRFGSGRVWVVAHARPRAENTFELAVARAHE